MAAIPGGRPGDVLVARCEHDRCGPLLEWRVERVPAALPQAAEPARAPWPTWATWALVGIGAAAATTIATIATGALEERPVESRFVAGGVRIE